MDYRKHEAGSHRVMPDDEFASLDWSLSERILTRVYDHTNMSKIGVTADRIASLVKRPIDDVMAALHELHELGAIESKAYVDGDRYKVTKSYLGYARKLAFMEVGLIPVRG